ncbi:MAG: LPS export ABC transporter permease LptG [Legionella sp.]|nr:LPS export ABC transporter permease LptG [Legionella sp.]
MKILDRYIAKNVLNAIGLITLMLTGLQIFILFVNQLGDLGRLDFGIRQAALFVLLGLPYQVYLFFPMASLLGCLVGLGVLANNSELIVMRAAGMSIGQIAGSVLKASLIVILLVTVLGETLVPFLTHYAKDYKVSALTGGQSMRTSQGIWLHYQHDFILIGTILPNMVLQDVYQFRFDDNQQLKLAKHIQEIKTVNGQWIAYGIKETEFAPDSTKVSQLSSAPWDVAVRPNILKISSIEPGSMTLHQLNQYLREQKRTQQNAHMYQLSFLQRIAQPFTTMVMMLLSIPFIFGPLRSSTMGSKLLVGAAVGFGFYIVNSFLGPISLVYQWPPAIAAFAPTIVFALLGLYLMRRVA